MYMYLAGSSLVSNHIMYRPIRMLCCYQRDYSVSFFLLQYYEMSYGLNVEMHKQVDVHVQTRPLIHIVS